MFCISLPLSLALALLISLPRCLPLSLSLSVSLSLSHIIVGGVDICATLQQRLHHVYVPVVARVHKSRSALDETRKEKNAH
jgi:hypothetical protein